MRPLNRRFFNRDTAVVARELLGCLLVRLDGGVRRVGRIVETEAYLGGHDRASHSSRGMTERNRVMFGPPGYAYVYLVYGMHHCMNIVTEPAGHGAAVLLRALEPVENLPEAASGPGRLCKAMRIGRSLNGHDMLSTDFHILPADRPPPPVTRRPRIGIAYAGPRWSRRLLRFCVRGNPHVSRP